MPSRSATPRPARRAWPWLLFGLALALLHNLVGWVGVRYLGHIDAGYRRANPLLTLGLLALVLGRWRNAAEISWRGASPRDLALGAGAGIALGLTPALAFAFPVGIHHGPIRFDLVGRLPARDFAWKVLVELPLFTALWEELAFRGVLEAGLRRSLSPAPAAAVSALVFAAGHGAVHHYSLKATNVGESWLPRPLVIFGMMLSVYAGGLSFSLLRHRTGSLVPPMLAHWLVDAVMLTAFFLLGHRRRAAP